MAYISQYLTDEQAKFVQKDYERSGESQSRFAWPVFASQRPVPLRGVGTARQKKRCTLVAGKRARHRRTSADARMAKITPGRKASFGRRRGSLALGSDARRNVRRSDAPKSIGGSDATFGGTQGLLRG